MWGYETFISNFNICYIASVINSNSDDIFMAIKIINVKCIYGFQAQINWRLKVLLWMLDEF